jgi:predicted DNA-binding ribbon-helix-helix protein
MSKQAGKRMNVATYRLDGRRIRLSFEPAMWDAIEECAADLSLTVAELVAHAMNRAPAARPASALQVFVLHHFRTRAEDATADLKPAAARRVH